MAATHDTAEHLPGANLDTSKMPGHWLLARLGKRVLRPGGLELTHKMLDMLAISSQDELVEFAPGLGGTARTALSKQPASYVGVERDEDAAASVQRFLDDPRYTCKIGTAEKTGLEDESATIVYGEAMLTMNTASQKVRIVREAFRILKPGGRYGIHEMSLIPDDISEERKAEIQRDLSQAIHVGARPLTAAEWRAILEAEGFQVIGEARAPMHLLQPKRMIQDEGLGRVLKIMFNILRDPAARKRVLGMRAVFNKYSNDIAAISLVAIKPS